MSTQVQFRRGNTAQTATFTGAVAEITVDTDKEVVVVHDGVTAGGFALARESALTANNQLSQAAFNHANSAFASSNSAGSYANSAFLIANSAANYSNTVNNTQNNSITAAFTAANSAGSYANGAFAAANAANATDTTQNNSITAAFTAANSAGVYANGAFATANNEAGVNLTQSNSITAAFTAANSAGVYANGAFARANNSLNANTGGTVTGTVVIAGDLDVTGNLVITGNTITQNVTSLNITDPLIYLAANNYSSDIVDIGWVGNYYDSTTTYSVTFLTGSGASASAGQITSDTSISSLVVSSNEWNTSLISFQSYSNSNMYKTILTRSNIAGWGVRQGVGLWRSTSAINQIQLFADGGANCAANSTFTLYGITAA